MKNLIVLLILFLETILESLMVFLIKNKIYFMGGQDGYY